MEPLPGKIKGTYGVLNKNVRFVGMMLIAYTIGVSSEHLHHNSIKVNPHARVEYILDGVIYQTRSNSMTS